MLYLKCETGMGIEQKNYKDTLPFTVTAVEGVEFECTGQWQHVRCAASYLNLFLQDHIGQCPKFPLPCPNSCGVSIPREKVRHLLVLFIDDYATYYYYGKITFTFKLPVFVTGQWKNINENTKPFSLTSRIALDLRLAKCSFLCIVRNFWNESDVHVS